MSFPSSVASWLRLLACLCTLCISPISSVIRSNQQIPVDLLCRGQGPDVQALVLDGYVSITSGYLCAIINRVDISVPVLRADFHGKGQYGKNVLAGNGLVLERESPSGEVLSSVGTSLCSASKVSLNFLSRTPDNVTVELVGVSDGCMDDSTVEETWRLTVVKGARHIHFASWGSPTTVSKVKAIRHSFSLAPSSIYALFGGGVAQMKDGIDIYSYYFSNDSLSLLYSLGGAGPDLHRDGDLSVSMVMGASKGTAGLVALYSNKRPMRSHSGFTEGFTGFQRVLAGGYSGRLHLWGKGWSKVTDEYLVGPQQSWHTSMDLFPNDADFPTYMLPRDTSLENMPYDDLRAFLTGVYASPVGNLCTQQNGVVPGAHVAQIATTIHAPTTGYRGSFNFWDPDNYFSAGALLSSGEPYLQEQVRLVLERSGEFLNEQGQLPHHFEWIAPTYVALSGMTQPGPNVFWILSCLNYVKATGNYDWLQSYMPTLRRASAFLYDMLVPEYGLVSTPGSLFIDVFIRNNLTTDTNAALVGFFREFADAEEAVGNLKDAAELRSLSDTLVNSINKHLWSEEEDDHYVTQRDVDDGAIRDFVDYDANLLALAHGVVPDDRVERLFKRLDGGRCTHGRATFVSEKYYGPNDTTNGNIGDSWCSMARIGWYDALARRRYKDLETFDHVILNPIRDDLNRWTWLHERYSCDGTPQLNRTEYYFEYPSLVTMLLREGRYGINRGLLEDVISPFGVSQYSYHIGNVHVEYSSPDFATFSFPGLGVKRIRVEGMAERGQYKYETSGCSVGENGRGSVEADSEGAAVFEVPLSDENGTSCTVDLRLEKSGGDAPLT